MWFLFAIVSVLAWGTADLFYKKGSDPKDKYSYLKIVIMVGAVMGIHAMYVLLTSGVVYEPRNMITYLPVSALYILSMRSAMQVCGFWNCLSLHLYRTRQERYRVC